MPLELRSIKKSDITPTSWDGGETFEFFIYPENADYKNRDFLFRISSATLVKSPSKFTQFPNYKRFLVMLNNNLEIIRNSKKENFRQGEVFSFLSEDKITSYSLGTDFNLMVSKRIKSSAMMYTNFLEIESIDFAFMFSEKNTLVTINNNHIEIKPNTLTILQPFDKRKYSISSEAKIIIGYIQL